MSGFKPTKFLSDVYRDLRDRRLLLPAVALLVALVAVPMVLAEPAPESTPAAPAPASNGAAALTPAVQTDDSVAVRNYSKRLDELKSKNPFKQQFTGASGSGDSSSTGDSGGEASTSDSTASTETTDSVSTGTDSSTTDVGAVVVASDDSTDNGSGSDNDKPHDPSEEDIETVTQLYTHRVDVTIGPEGDPKLHENVKPMTVLPDDATSVVAFLGTDEQGKRAAFVVSSQAVPVDGDFSCVPSPENCLYVTLHKGDTMTLQYGPDGQVFELKLIAIQDVEL